jgi:tight adherence protein B
VSLILAFLSVTQAAQRSPQVRIRRRLGNVAIRGQAGGAERSELAKRAVYSEIPVFHQLLDRYGFARSLDLVLEQAAVDYSVGAFLLISVAVGVVSFLVALSVLEQPLGPALLFGCLLAFVPFAAVQYRAKKRIRRFLEQMPDGLDIMAQGLQAGLGLSQAQSFVAKEMPDP